VTTNVVRVRTVGVPRTTLLSNSLDVLGDQLGQPTQARPQRRS